MIECDDCKYNCCLEPGDDFHTLCLQCECVLCHYHCHEFVKGETCFPRGEYDNRYSEENYEKLKEFYPELYEF